LTRLRYFFRPLSVELWRELRRLHTSKHQCNPRIANYKSLNATMEPQDDHGGEKGGCNPWDFYVPFGDLRVKTRQTETETDEEHGGTSTTKEKSHNDDAHPFESVSNSNRKSAKGWGQFEAFSAMAMPYFKENWEARWLFFVLVLLMLLNSAVSIVFSYLARDFWTALSDKNVEEFYSVIQKFLIALCCLAPINVFYRFQRQRLAIKWREWMSNRMLQLYYSNRVYYTLERSRLDSNIDNPDQRIAEDCKSFTQYSLSLFLTISVSLIDLVCFSIILYSIQPSLFVSIIGFALVGTLTTVLIGKTLVRLNFERLQKEADFRYSLVRIRENAESIAFFRGQDIEGQQVHGRLDRVVANAYAIIGTQRNLDLFSTLYNYLTWILPIVVIAPEYFAGNVELGVVQQAAAAFAHVLDDLSIIINEFESLSEFLASIDRLFQFVSAIQEADPDRDDDSPLMNLLSTNRRGMEGANDHDDNDDYKKRDGIVKTAAPVTTNTSKFMSSSRSIDLRQLPPLGSTDHYDYDRDPTKFKNSTNGVALSLRNLHLVTPDHSRTLIATMDLELRWGENLLIVGPSGAGKSSLLRAIAGLWTAGSGVIERPNTCDVYFLPQLPYCPLGTLKDQLLYPSTFTTTTVDGDDHHDGGHYDPPRDPRDNPSKPKAINLSEEDLLEILALVDLADLATRAGSGDAHQGLNTVMDWGNTLSLGEQQRLAFGRILVNRPRLVILDESTSALDVACETRMYALLKSLGRTPTTSNRGADVGTSDGGRTRTGGGAPLTFISVGHRPTLLAHHNTRLHLKGAESYSIDPIETTAETPLADEVNLFFQ
jgi:putative ATP-binding cassette transporter